MKPEQSPLNQKESKPSNTLAKYAGLGMQMMVTIAVAGVIGYFIDRQLSFRFPLFLLVFVIMAMVGSIYLLMKNLPKE